MLCSSLQTLLPALTLFFPICHKFDMATKPVALILGSGPRVGASVAAKFLANGYNVAVVSRKGDKADEGILSLKADFAEPDSVASVFEKVESEFKAAPSVVVYNAAALTPPVSKDNMFTIPADKFSSDLNVNTVSAYVAAQKAVAGWATLPKETKKTFIYTGNAAIVHTVAVPMLLNLGVGKSASAYFIEVADTLYSANGSR